MLQPSAEDFAAMVRMTVKAAMAPVLERLATAEQVNKDLQARVLELGVLRERLAAVETKAHDAVDVAPIIQAQTASIGERVAATETRLAALVGVTDRVTTLEAKAAQVMPLEAPVVDLQPTLDAIAAVKNEVKEVTKDFSAMRERVAGLETKTAQPVAPMPEIDLRPGPALTAIADLRGELKECTKDLGAIKERVAAVEARAPIPGPAGKDGAPGPAGKDGKDGVDGLGMDDVLVEFDDDRTIAVKFQRGVKVKTFPIKLPMLRYQGTYTEGKQYDVGDLVTWGGAMHYCKEATITKPGGESRAWQLCVKRGADGRDGRDASSLPVVKVG